MKCSKCGMELKTTDKFCGNCGEKVVVVEEPKVTEEKKEEKPIEKSPVMNNDLSKNQSTCTIFGIVGLCLSFFINILSLPFSIIAMVKGSKIKKETHKTEPGFVLGLIGAILSAIIFVFWIFVFVFAIIGVSKGVKDLSKYDYSDIEEKIEDVLEDKKKIGNNDVGYIYIPEDWVVFHDTDVNDENMIQYSDKAGDQIVTMTVFKDPSFTLEQYQANLEDLLKKDNDSGFITSYDSYISDYEVKTKKIGGQYQGKYLYTWTFADNSKNVYYIAIESTEYDTDVFELIDHYKLPENVKVEDSTY